MFSSNKLTEIYYASLIERAVISSNGNMSNLIFFLTTGATIPLLRRQVNEIEHKYYDDNGMIEHIEIIFKDGQLVRKKIKSPYAKFNSEDTVANLENGKCGLLTKDAIKGEYIGDVNVNNTNNLSVTDVNNTNNLSASYANNLNVNNLNVENLDVDNINTDIFRSAKKCNLSINYVPDDYLYGQLKNRRVL